MPTEDALVEVEVSDKDLYDAAMADEPANEPEAQATESEPEAETDGQPRDESGRFAPKAGEQPAAAVTPPAAQQPNDADSGQIPAWRLREEAENRRAAEARAQQFERELVELRRNPPKAAEQPKPETKPDPLLDPEGYEAYLERKVEARFAQAEQNRIKERGEASLQAARESNTELFDKAYAEVQRRGNAGDTLTLARISQARDPGKELLSWYREQETVREVGGDPAAYRTRILDEALKDPAYQAKVIAAIRAQQAPQNVNGNRQPSPVRIPPSLASVTPSGAALSADDDVSDEGIWNSATAGMRR
jgi:hypothetical protein